MREFTVRDAVAAIGGSYRGDPSALDRVITNVVSDSRMIGEGTLFAAFKGARVDGHDFMADCLKRGAVLCISEREPRDETEQPCVVVESTLRAAGALAGWYRGLFDIPVVGITGSVGKTTTKEMVACVLSAKLKTHKTQKNFNNELGVPRTLINTPEDAEAAVVEMGISDFGEMSRLTRMVRPSIAIITVIGDAHLEFLGDHAGVLRAKSEIFESMNDHQLAILNGDDETLKAYAAPIPKLTYGKGADNDFVGEDIEFVDGGMTMTIRHHGRKIDCRIPAFGSHLCYAALAAACVGWTLGLTDEEIARGMADYRTVGERARLIDANGLHVISDCYNANPSSVSSAVDSLSGLKGRRVCVLGDMLELGRHSCEMHYGVGAYAAKHGADMVLACGELSREIVRGATENGIEAHWFDTKETLIERIGDFVREGDNVLIKASHSMAFTDIVDRLVK